MKNKIVKYIKLIINMTLILSLITPSFASLSASDGSAFVTKAEFDSALSDFNARLTTFEAGINSKIDSQVTSYLDRNGIWSGRVQDSNAVPSVSFGLHFSKDTSMRGWVFNSVLGNMSALGSNKPTHEIYISPTSQFKPVMKACPKCVFVANISKSGLCNVNILQDGAFKSVALFQGAVLEGGTAMMHGDNWGYAAALSYCLYERPTGATESDDTLCWNYDMSISIGGAQTFGLRYPAIMNGYFFVKKGSTIIFEGCVYEKAGKASPVYTSSGDNMLTNISSWSAVVY